MTARSTLAADISSTDERPTCREIVFESSLLLGIHLAMALAVVITLAAIGVG